MSGDTNDTEDGKLVKYVVSEKPQDPVAVQVVYCCRRCKGTGEAWDGSGRPPRQCPDCGGTGLAGFASVAPAALSTARSTAFREAAEVANKAANAFTSRNDAQTCGALRAVVSLLNAKAKEGTQP